MTHRLSRFCLRRFSLRTGLLAFLLICIALGIAGRWMQDIRNRGAAQRRVIAKCAAAQTPLRRIQFLRAPETKASWFTAQVRRWVDPEYGCLCRLLVIDGELLEDESFHRDITQMMPVHEVRVFGVFRPHLLVKATQAAGVKQLTIDGIILAEDDATDWSSVSAAKSLETVDFQRHYLSENLARELTKLPNLKAVRDVVCSAEAVVSLAQAPKLTELVVKGGAWRHAIEEEGDLMSEAAERVYFHDCGVKCFSHLANRKELKILSLDSTFYLEPADLAEFCKNSPLTELTLIDSSLKPECLAEFAKLSRLETLTLIEDQIEDQNLPALANAQHLKRLEIRGNTTTEGIEALRTLLPTTSINGQLGPTKVNKPNTTAAAP